MEREQIVRDDFPSARKGWSPEAVRAHLIAVAAAYPEPQHAPSPAADATSERVQSVIAAAETAAAEIVAEARSEAEQIRATARAESEQTVNDANREATGRVEQARGAVEGLIAQADRLRSQVGALGRDLASSMPGAGSPNAADDPSPAVDEDRDPEPEPEPEPEPGPEPAAPGAAQAPPSDEELIAELRGGGPVADRATAPASDPTADADHGAARLVAMNMALDGASRERIAARIESEFGGLGAVDALLDDVLSRAGR